jgi:hypothetical protein
LKNESDPHTQKLYSGKKLFVFIGLIFIATVFIAYLFIDDPKNGWGEVQKAMFISACSNSGNGEEENHGLSDEQLKEYCTCVQAEVMALYPDGPPTRQIDQEVAQRIMLGCFQD